ncbi:MAG: M28 family peptidase [Ignavibacteriae bacterium]|nr:M28 family peptidase [Ignavibacteriota bacterium]
MKKTLLLIFVILITETLLSQVIYNHKIDSVINLVNAQNISKLNKELSGDTSAVIGGIPQLILSRYAPTTGNIKAAQYIFEKLQGYGYTAKYHMNNATNINVYAEKLGTKYPGKKYIIGAHYDDIINPLPLLTDTIHGADDNASGVCAVLEAARLLKNFNSDYTLIFIAFDEEELGLLGSKGFADSSYFRGDTLLGVINLDMIGWDGNNDTKFTVMTDNNSMSLADDFIDVIQKYNLGLIVNKSINGSGSDHQSFWARNYRAITGIEDMGDFNTYYHSKGDMFNKFNVPYFVKAVKASVATLMTWAIDYHVTMLHNPIPSGMDTSAKITTVTIHFPNNIGVGANAPRIYYKFGNGQYNFVNAFEVNGDIYKFRIPGRPPGSKISYYIAAQDSAGANAVTLPKGGSGLNPPGTIPPSSPFIYYVWTSGSFCSNTSPKPITDMELTTDTIWIPQIGLVTNIKVNLNINHTNDGDIVIMLVSPSSSTTLSQYNGTGGQNYTNTTFDDSASISIIQGTPPFTGSYKPQSAFSFMLNQQLQGPWVLKIYDNKIGDQGTLLSWCLNLKYASTISVKENNGIINCFKLYQNYPNPFNPSTNIKFQIPKNCFVSLKVYDLLGKEVETLVNGNYSQGTYEVVWDAKNFPSGLYFYRLQAGEYSETKKTMVLK